MRAGFKEIRGYLWPESDIDCAAVVFDWLPDLDQAVAVCEKFDVAVQAGGNCGVWPKKLAEKFKAVYTFEPEPQNFTCLAYNCPQSNIVKFQAALGLKRKMVSMAYEHGPRNMGAVYVDGGGNIPVLKIDDLCLPACDLIQLDLEGYDLEALMGGYGTIARFKPVIMAEDKGLSRRYGVEQGEIERYLKPLGYKVRARPHRDIIFSTGGLYGGTTI